ncbi:MAG: malonyl-ACP O-methyltransferase BioC, partial [Cycloclasticus sp.]|nr:malonyl-ACP O-methyltransferase BioC [Cycloclasticus sp.]
DFASLQRMIGDTLMQKYVADVSEDTFNRRRVLDIGAGTGYLTNKLANTFQSNQSNELIALDIAPDMLKTAIKATAQHLLNFICADAEVLPLANNTINAIFSNLAFQWSTDLATLFSECYRVLDADGVMAFSSFGPKTLLELNQAWAAADDHVHVNSFIDATEIEQQLSAVGFQAIDVVYEELTFYYPSAKSLMRDLKGMGAHNINEQRKKGLMGVSAFKRMLLSYEQLRDKKGLPATFQAVYGFARKPAGPTVRA